MAVFSCHYLALFLYHQPFVNVDGVILYLDISIGLSKCNIFLSLLSFDFFQAWFFFYFLLLVINQGKGPFHFISHAHIFLVRSDYLKGMRKKQICSDFSKK